MADKSSFGPESSESEIDASVGELSILVFFLIKQLFYSGLLDIK